MDADRPTLAQSVVCLKDWLAFLRAVPVVLDVVADEQVMGLAGVVARLEAKRELLMVEIEALRTELRTLKQDRQQGAGGPGKGG